MITRVEASRERAKAAALLRKARIIITPCEKRMIEVVDFGLGEIVRTGLEIITYVNTDRYCAKELILLPGQTCPEHLHPNIRLKGRIARGKMETFRCRWGVVYLHVPGPKTARPKAGPPRGRERHYTARREIALKPGEQFTIPPGTPHWFKAGPKGAVVSEFSSTSRDESDRFRDPGVRRATIIR